MKIIHFSPGVGNLLNLVSRRRRIRASCGKLRRRRRLNRRRAHYYVSFVILLLIILLNDKPSRGGKRFSTSPIRRVCEELKRRFIYSVVAERARLHTTHTRRKKILETRGVEEMSKKMIQDFKKKIINTLKRLFVMK